MDTFKEQSKRILEEMGDVTKLAADHIKEELEHEINKEKIKNKTKHIGTEIKSMTQEAKDKILDKLD